MVRELEQAAAENKMQLAGLNSPVKGTRDGLSNRLKQAQMQADLAMETGCCSQRTGNAGRIPQA